VLVSLAHLQPLSCLGYTPHPVHLLAVVYVCLQAWCSGRFDRFNVHTLVLSNVPIKPQPSDSGLAQTKLLADIRHLLATHTAAAAAAAAAAAEAAKQTAAAVPGQYTAMQPPQGADVGPPMESGAQGAGQQGRLGWGDLDMQRLLMQEPGLILVSMAGSWVAADTRRVC
jgi:hypothetical protein